MEVFDVVVVGAGNGGLVAGASVAKEGYKTLVLEKHNLPGGCATSFVRGRFEFEAALHELCEDSTGSESDSARKILDRLDVDIPFFYEKQLFRAIAKGEDGYDVRLRPGYDDFLDDMEAAVPGCRESVKKLFDLMPVLDEAQVYMDQPVFNPVKLMTDYGDFIITASHSMEDVMNQCGIPAKAQSILSTYWGYLGVPMDDMNALHYMSMVAAFIKTPPSMPYHRSHEISLALVKSIQAYGGEVRFNSEVTKFLYSDKGAVIGVEVGGNAIYAKKVISNIIPNNVWNLSEQSAIPKSAVKLANARKLGMTFVTVYLGLDASADELGIEDYSIFISSSTNSRRQFNERLDYGMYVVNCLNVAIPEASEPGTSMLFFTMPIMPGDFPENLKPEEYKRYKNDFAEKYISDYEKTMGISIREHIEEIVVATPATFARYLATPDGCIYGYANEQWDNIVARTVLKDMENKVPNLYFCGGHTIRGGGYPSAYITGAMTGEAVVKALKGGK
ncbi:MAG: NAD(P)/FAD-dependent oxidoreductase [Clostridia bacterium]|nr:NAD(P)/FAD-dependent oxidoreductase [Clostridia bacterium]